MSTTPRIAILSDITPTRGTVEILGPTDSEVRDMSDAGLVAWVPAGTQVGQRIRLSYCEEVSDPLRVIAEGLPNA